MKELKEFNEFESKLIEFKNKYDGVVYDLDDKKQNKQARSDRRSIGTIVANLDRRHKDLKAPILEKSRLLDSKRKQLKDDLRLVQSNIGDQIIEHERKIQEHKDMLQGKVNQISFAADFDISNPTSSDYESRISELNKIVIDESFEHRQENAINEKARILGKLERLYKTALQAEQDKKELEELRAKQAEQERKDREALIAQQAAENARIEAERIAQEKIDLAKAEALRIKQENQQALINAELEAKAKEEQAEREKQQAITNERLRIENEQRIKQEQINIENAEIERKKSLENHRNKIHKAAKKSLLENGFDCETATKIITLIKDNKIDCVTIEY